MGVEADIAVVVVGVGVVVVVVGGVSLGCLDAGVVLLSGVVVEGLRFLSVVGGADIH